MRATLCFGLSLFLLAAGCADKRSVDWREHGVRIVRSDQLDLKTKQTSGMTRAVAVNHAMAGAKKLWAGTVIIDPGVAAGAHHHGHLESVVYVIRGMARFRWGNNLEYFADAGPGDFVYVPPYVPHQEINPGDESVEVVLVRSDQEPVVINLDIPTAVETPSKVDAGPGFHPRP